MTKSKKGFGDDLIGAYATKQTEEVKSADEVTPAKKDIKNIEDVENKYNVDNKHNTKEKHIIDNKHDIDDVSISKKRGRPKVTDRETRSKNFNLLMKPSTFKGLNRIVGLKLIETGERVSVTDLINTILEEFIVRNSVIQD